MGYAAVGAVQIGGPYRVDGTATKTPEPAADLRLRAAAVRSGHRLRDEDPVADGATGLPATGRRRRTCRRCSSSSSDGRRDGGTSTPGIQFALERMLVDPDFLLRVHKDPAAIRVRLDRGAID